MTREGDRLQAAGYLEACVSAHDVLDRSRCPCPCRPQLSALPACRLFPPMIELIDFTKHYGDLVAVDRLNLKIAPGEMFGPSVRTGAGRTSIRFLATLLKATGGGDRQRPQRHPSPAGSPRSIGYARQLGVYDGMKVWEFLDFFAVAYRFRRRAASR